MNVKIEPCNTVAGTAFRVKSDDMKSVIALIEANTQEHLKRAKESGRLPDSAEISLNFEVKNYGILLYQNSWIVLHQNGDLKKFPISLEFLKKCFA